MMEIVINVPFVDKIGVHLKKHKTKYFVGTGVIVVAGIAYYIGTRNGSSRLLSPNASIFGINNKMDQTVIQLAERSGPPSWKTFCWETGEEVNSQRAMAYLHRISEHDLSDHLNGHLENVGGKHYGRRGLVV
jgi:hypothetical protein